jgi:hypothetical protein
LESSNQRSQDPSTDGRITSNRTSAKRRSKTASRVERNGKRSLRRPKLSTRKFSAWKKKKKKKKKKNIYTALCNMYTVL